MFGETIKYIHFHNDTDFPIMIDAWVDNSNKLHSRKVCPRESVVLHSSVGEWHINSMLCDEEDRKIWKDAGFEKHTIVGKFRSSPCAVGDYSWMEYDEPFDCVYCDDGDEKIKGKITFLQKNR
jgi:hypothetical protein